ncbi:hypothetical protein [Umezawaea beigongshangensis]|uniref:hypothetical protein n=1 Tax=Umezawaea beigongshangensis TaxID=2780383 RepID=UPI0018F2271A|nr:hypothetical protein [Umezawaea beigongshangensis]
MRVVRGGAVAALVLVTCAGVLAGCGSEEPRESAPPPSVPVIAPPASAVATSVMADRPVPDDCELVVPAEDVSAVVGKDLAKPVEIVGVPEPAVARTAKLDCYYGVPEGRQVGDAAVIIGLSNFSDEASATQRITESVDAEKQEGATVEQIDVGEQKASYVVTKEERFVAGTIGRSSFVVRAKPDALPDDRVKAVLADLAARSMTAPAP